MPTVALVDQAGTASGVGSFLRSLTEALLESPAGLGWEFSVLLPEIDYGGRPVDWPEHVRSPRLQVVQQGDARPEAAGRDSRAWLEAMLRACPADVAYFAFPFLCLPPRVAAPMVATFHDFNYKRFETWSDELRRRCEIEVPLWLAACRLAVVSSSFIAGELAAYYPDQAARARIVRLGIPAGTAPLDAAAWTGFRAARGIPEEFLLTAGWLTPHKNQSVLLEAVALLRDRGIDLPVVITGPNSDQLVDLASARDTYARHLARLALAWRLEPGVHYFPLGHVSRPELESLYAHAAALVMPTLYEAGSFPIREAMRLGCPVVAADVPALVEDVELAGGQALLFDPLDPEDLARFLRRLLDDPEGARRRAELAQSQVIQAFDWSRTAAGYLAAFETALA